MRRTTLALAALTVLATGCASTDEQATPRADPPAHLSASPSRPTASASPTQPSQHPQATARVAARLPLRGVVIALDPGHQLGNHRFPRQTNALVPSGGFRKPCNTTGTATDSGVAESTVNFRLAKAVQARLRSLGATVRLTRTTDSEALWGPCVDARGRFAALVGARLMVSLHADGAPSSARGFHVISPTARAPWTTDIARRSRRLARLLRDSLTAAGIPRSTYLGGGTGLVRRSDLGTLNMSDVPVAMIEIGNMRNASDARRMTSAAGQARYVAAIVGGIRATLRR